MKIEPVDQYFTDLDQTAIKRPTLQLIDPFFERDSVAINGS